MKWIIITVVVLAVAFAAYFAGKKGLSVSFNNPSPTAEASITPAVSSSPAATPDESADLITSVRAGLIDEHGQSAGSMSITISKIEGNYAKGMANDQGGGGIWFAAKVSGTWKLVFDGNGIIQCSNLTNYPNFPKDLIPTCWDTTTNELITR